MLCNYGCGQEAKFKMTSGKYCCSKHYSSCPSNRQKNSKSNIGRIVSKETRKKLSISNKGQTPWNKGKCGVYSNATLLKKSNSVKGFKHSNITKNKLSKINKGKKLSKETKIKISNKLKNRKFSKNHIIKLKRTISKINERYPTFSKIEEMRYNPNKPGEKEIQVHCKNHNCKNSKEQGGWFTPTGRQIEMRINAIENGNDGFYFYCCKECKQECPLFNLRSDSFKVVKKLYTSSEYQTFRQQVLTREDYICEYCGEKANIVHHIMPQKLEPIHVLDPDFGVACCTKCHYKYGHKDECGTGVIANKECVS